MGFPSGLLLRHIGYKRTALLAIIIGALVEGACLFAILVCLLGILR